MNALRLCPSGKWSYGDERGALKALRLQGCRPDHMHRKGREPRRFCPRCGFWHLTSKAPGGKR
jgi:hypothetical protein